MGSKRMLVGLLVLTFLLSGCAETVGSSSFSAPSDNTEVDTTQVDTVVAEEEATATQPTTNIEIDLDDPNVVEIGETLFLTQINDIYYNFADYEDKTIVVEGMYTTLYTWDGSSSCSAVYRLGPGCCGNDGWGGFLLVLNSDSLPRENDWVQVIGTPELVSSDGGYTDLYLNVISIEVMTERGEEFVLQ